MTTKTICGCGHPISDHTYSEDFTGCDQSKCTCNLDLGAYIDNLNADLADAKARAKTAEENWHKNEARIAKLETEKDAYLEFYKANADAWKEYAKHQEYCAVCAENVDDCEIGTALRSVADVSFEDVISL